MGMMEYDGIIFSSIEDLLAYKEKIAERRQPAARNVVNIIKPIPNISERQETGKKQQDKQEKNIVFKGTLKDNHEFIKAYYAANKTKGGHKLRKGKIRKLARMLKAKESAIFSYVSKFGITKERPATQTKPKKDGRIKFWTAERDALLMDGKHTIKEICQITGKSYKAVGLRALRLKNKGQKVNYLRYMSRRRPKQVLSYQQQMIKQTEKSKRIEHFPNISNLSAESHKTLEIMLKDAKQRNQPIGYNLASANLTNIKGYTIQITEWQEIVYALLRNSKALLSMGLKIIYDSNKGQIRVE